MKRTAFFISDGTGITAETLGQSLLAQFETISFTKLTRPYIDSVDKARAMVQQINTAAEKDGARPIIFDTLVNQDIRDILAESEGFMIDIFSTFLAPLEQELTSHSSYTVGKSHSISHNSNYMERIDAVNFALDNDDGARTHYYDKADLILVGVSRCGKTPTCLYMAMQFGIRAANYPLTEEDMERLQLPAALLAGQAVVAHGRHLARQAHAHQLVLRAQLGQQHLGLALGIASQGRCGLQACHQGNAHDAQGHQHLDQGEAMLALGPAGGRAISGCHSVRRRRASRSPASRPSATAR